MNRVAGSGGEWGGEWRWQMEGKWWRQLMGGGKRTEVSFPSVSVHFDSNSSHHSIQMYLTWEGAKNDKRLQSLAVENGGQVVAAMNWVGRTGVAAINGTLWMSGRR